jgi:hypothetical protein
MKQLTIAFASLLLLNACSSNTHIVSSWRDPAVTVHIDSLNKFVVAALLKNPSIRRQVEDEMAALMPGKAVPSYKEFGTTPLKDGDTSYNQKLKSKGYDGIVIMGLNAVNQRTSYVAPVPTTMYYSSWRGNWSMSWRGYYDPGYYTTEKIYHIEVNVFSLRSDKLIWSANTSTVDPSGKSDLYSSVGQVVSQRMKKEGFLK